jgi:uncharacterized damage-inducible protein DinB/uncharacterized glyoxalase superfamily protein PhnB
MNEILANLFRHNLWANRRMFEACLPLTGEQLATDVAGTYGRLDETLQHLAASEGGYVNALDGWSPPDGHGLGPGVPFPGVPFLLERIRMTGEALIEVARAIRPEQEVDAKGETFTAWVVLLQAAYHATEHRQQIATMLTRLGIEPPEPDYWAFDEARRRGEVEAEALELPAHGAGNRSVPADTVIPHLVYEDVGGASAWLRHAFGFDERFRYGDPADPEGVQLSLGRAVVMLHHARPGLASPSSAGVATQSVTVFVDDLDAHGQRALVGGARIVEELHETEYGELQYGAVDLAGHRWTFARHVRDMAPEDWGATVGWSDPAETASAE